MKTCRWLPFYQLRISPPTFFSMNFSNALIGVDGAGYFFVQCAYLNVVCHFCGDINESHKLCL